MLITDNLRQRGWTRWAIVALMSLLFLVGLSFPVGAPQFAAMVGSPVANAAQVHTVTYGESLWRIANNYGLTVDALRQANDLWGDLITPGQRLIIPQGRATAGTTPAVSAADRDLLARLVRAEAEGQPYAGKVAVAAVVLNRTRSGLFPTGIWAAVYEPYQFEPVLNGRIGLPAGGEDHQAVTDALNGWDPSYGALYFFNPAKAGNPFLWSRPITTTIGSHRFTL